jgi:hypothetical protein
LARRITLLVNFVVREMAVAHRAVRRLTFFRRWAQSEIQRMRRQPIAWLAEGVNAIAGPSRLLGRTDNVGSKWIQLNVPKACVPIALIVEQDGAITFIPDCSPSLVFPVEVLRVTTVSKLHRPGQPALGVGSGHQMVVGRHEGEGMNADVIVNSRLGHNSTKVFSVPLIAANRFSIDAAWEYVNADTGYENTRWIGHASRRARIVLAGFSKKVTDDNASGSNVCHV